MNWINSLTLLMLAAGVLGLVISVDILCKKVDTMLDFLKEMRNERN